MVETAEIDENLHDAAKLKPYYKSMVGSTKQVQTYGEVQDKERRDLLVEPSHGMNGRDSRPPYKPYGSLERLTRILIDIARNPHTGNEPERADNSLQ